MYILHRLAGSRASRRMRGQWELTRRVLIPNRKPPIPRLPGHLRRPKPLHGAVAGRRAGMKLEPRTTSAPVQPISRLDIMKPSTGTLCTISSLHNARPLQLGPPDCSASSRPAVGRITAVAALAGHLLHLDCTKTHPSFD